MEHVIAELNKTGRHIDVIVGGAAVTQKFAEKIGASGYARDAIKAVEIVEKLLKNAKL
jgi:5-methyltetrahydrofolate--homocysteine methyltransferase